jgi:hypothetical protein
LPIPLKTSSKRLAVVCWTELVASYGIITMRAFIVACVVTIVIAVGSAAILDNLVQKNTPAAFGEPNVRI